MKPSAAVNTGHIILQKIFTLIWQCDIMKKGGISVWFDILNFSYSSIVDF